MGGLKGQFKRGAAQVRRGKLVRSIKLKGEEVHGAMFSRDNGRGPGKNARQELRAQESRCVGAASPIRAP